MNDVSSPETEVLMTYDDQDNYLAAYSYGIERIKEQALDDTRPESQDPLYYLYDGLGSVSQMIRPNGAVRDHYGYDEYGIPAPGAKLSEDGRNVNHNTFGYTGEMWDEEDNLLYLRSRYYMPEVGRFITRDVFPGFAANPLSMHKYAYVENNPVNWVDPLGFNKKDNKVVYGPPSPIQIYGPPNPFMETGAFVDSWQLLDGYTQGTVRTDQTFINKTLQFIEDAGNALMIGNPIPDNTIISTPRGNIPVGSIDNALGALIARIGKFGKFLTKADDVVEGAGKTGIIEQHHLLPQQFKKQFEKAGLDIEKYKIPLDKADHRLKPDGLHTGANNWNKQWDDFFEQYPNAKQDQILNQLDKMQKATGLK